MNEKRFGTSIKNLIDYIPEKIISKHHADAIYPIVSASSIIAKTKRDAVIEEIKGEYGEIGSGYPSDKTTIDFLREYLKKYRKWLVY